MDKKKKVIIGVAAAIVAIGCLVAVLFATHVLCIHKWQEATCTEPSICSTCGRSKGKALGHEVEEWEVVKDPTCTEEGLQEGECIRCGKKQTEKVDKLPHTEGEWETTKDWSINSGGGINNGEEIKKCTVCGEEIDKQELKPDLTTAEENACKYAASWMFSSGGTSRLQLIQYMEEEGFTTEEATLAADRTGADWKEEAVKAAKISMDGVGMSRSMMMEELTVWMHFTEEEANYACDQVGL